MGFWGWGDWLDWELGEMIRFRLCFDRVFEKVIGGVGSVISWSVWDFIFLLGRVRICGWGWVLIDTWFLFFF